MAQVHTGRLLLLILFLATACESPKPADQNIPAVFLEEITIQELQDGYASGKFTIEEVVSGYLERIKALDDSGPELNAVVYVNPNAIQQAREMDSELKAGKKRGALHGVPVILKDNIDTYDMPTTAGSRALMNSVPAKDAFIADKLRAAGAIILAKANLSEWANYRASRSSSGWSGVGGQTKNPYVLDRNPCGSSSGSGVSSSASLCAIAIGTETNGSIVCPSNNNGLVGLKPTVGLLSRSGIIPISSTQDTAGPMGRTVADVATVLGSMTGVDSTDEASRLSKDHIVADYTSALKADGLRGKRIGWLRTSGGYDPRVDTLMKRAVELLKAQGAEVIDVNESLSQDVYKASSVVMLTEFKAGLEVYFATLGSENKIKTLNDLIAFNKQDSVELKYFDQQRVIQAAAAGSITDQAYLDARATMLKLSREEGIDKWMNAMQLDALISPTGAAAWKTDLIDGDHFMGGSSSLAAISGYPSITVPMGFVDELPVGISFTGRAWSEALLLQVAYGYEQATHHRKKPRFFSSR